MPYIGNSQVAGVHQNNFKIVDDISSYTETFDGSSSSVVNTTNNTTNNTEINSIKITNTVLKESKLNNDINSMKNLIIFTFIRN